MRLDLAAIRKRLSGLTGFKKYLTAFCLGALMVASLPPIGAFPVLLLCVPGFIWLVRESKTKRDAFLTGWAFGAGYFILGLYWISVALFVDIASFWWVLPFSAIAGPALYALYYGFVPLLAWRYRQHETAHVLMLVTGWAFVEWVRGHALTGFPWNLMGYTWDHVLPVMQANAAVGIYGLTLLTLLWAAIPALQRKLAVLLITSFAIVAAAGTWRMMQHPTVQSGNHTVRIVQPNIPQSVKWDPEVSARNFRHHIDLTAAPSTMKDPVTFVIWPETAVTADIQANPYIAQAIASSMPKDSVALLGNLRRPADDEFYNSVVVLNKKGQTIDIYDKHHLVPFGEYIPFRHTLNMTPIAAGIAMVGDFRQGSGVSTLRIGTLPKPSPLVCYEAIFPGQVARQDDRPDWLLNVTNDGWYGMTAGPHQHFDIVRVRAVEEGLPLVRAANTGISGTIDPIGRVIGRAELGTRGIVDTILPQPLPPTIYGRFGDALFFLMLVLLTITGEALRSRE